MKNGRFVLGLLFLLSACSTTSSWWGMEHDPESLMEGEGPKVQVAPVTQLQQIDKPLSMRAFRVVPGGPLEDLALPSTTDDLVIHVLNIGAGSCQLVECPNSDEVLVVDCGSIGPSPKDKTSQDIKTYFDEVATGNVKLVLSHPDRDHINKIPMLFTDRLPESIWLGGKYSDYRGKVADFLDRAANAGIPIAHGWPAGFANRGHPVSGLQCGTANAFVLTVNTEGSKNAQSLVLLLDYGDFRAILSGDAEEETEEAVIKAYGALIKDTSVLLASHHGANSGGSNHEAWIEATNPQVVVFSSGTLYGHPREPVVERYQDIHQANVASHAIWWGIGNTHQEPVDTQFPHYVTEQNGTITIRTDGSDFTVECSEQSECY